MQQTIGIGFAGVRFGSAFAEGTKHSRIESRLWRSRFLAIFQKRWICFQSYPDPVRVISVGKPIDTVLEAPHSEENLKSFGFFCSLNNVLFRYSIEFCGGTHLKNTKDAEAFVLLTEEGIANGVRRLVAVTGCESNESPIE